MTFDYKESTIILGPLSAQADPAGYDLCQKHADKLSAPRGWQVIRLANSFREPPGPNEAELEALADAVRAASDSPTPRKQMQDSPNAKRSSRGHLSLVQPWEPK